MSAEPLGPDLYAYLVNTLYSVPAFERQRLRWVMSAEWEAEIRAMTGFDGRALWVPSVTVKGPDLLLGLPFEVREDAGIPELEPA